MAPRLPFRARVRRLGLGISNFLPDLRANSAIKRLVGMSLRISSIWSVFFFVDREVMGSG